MAGSTLIAGKIYSLFEYFVALSLVVGMILFSFGDMRGGVNWLDGDNAKLIFGIVVLLLALSCDSVLGNLQEKVQKAKVCDESSLMFVQSVVSALLLLVWTLASGELREGISHCWQDPQVSLSLLAWAVSNMAGTQEREGGREGVWERERENLVALHQGVAEKLMLAAAGGVVLRRHCGDAAGGWGVFSRDGCRVVVVAQGS
jgi:hypothetical protein